MTERDSYHWLLRLCRAGIDHHWDYWLSCRFRHLPSWDPTMYHGLADIDLLLFDYEITLYRFCMRDTFYFLPGLIFVLWRQAFNSTWRRSRSTMAPYRPVVPTLRHITTSTGTPPNVSSTEAETLQFNQSNFESWTKPLSQHWSCRRQEEIMWCLVQHHLLTNKK